MNRDFISLLKDGFFLLLRELFMYNNNVKQHHKARQMPSHPCWGFSISQQHMWELCNQNCKWLNRKYKNVLKTFRPSKQVLCFTQTETEIQKISRGNENDCSLFIKQLVVSTEIKCVSVNWDDPFRVKEMCEFQSLTQLHEKTKLNS